MHIIYVQKDKKMPLISITKKNYKAILKEMMVEYPDLQAKIGKRGYGFRTIGKTVKEYNEWMKFNWEERFK